MKSITIREINNSEQRIIKCRYSSTLLFYLDENGYIWADGSKIFEYENNPFYNVVNIHIKSKTIYLSNGFCRYEFVTNCEFCGRKSLKFIEVLDQKIYYCPYCQK